MHRMFWLATAALLAIPAGAVAEDKPTPSEPGLPEPLPASVVYVSDVTLLVDGRRVDAAPVGVEVVAGLAVQNGASAHITNLRISVSAPSEGEARLVTSQAFIGELAPAQTRVGEISLVVRPERCNDFIGFAGQATFDQGSSPLKIGIPVSCPGPRLTLEGVTFEGGDGDGVAEPGETVEMFLQLRNDGRDSATAVRGSLALNGDGISGSTTNVRWADLRPGESARSIVPVVFTISKDAPRQETCQGLPRGEPVADDTDPGELPPDSTVSSDGTVSPPAPGTDNPQSVPESSGAGGTATGWGSGGAAEEAPSRPIERAPDPETESQDMPVRLAVGIAVSATGYRTTLDYSTEVICALREGARDLGPETVDSSRGRGASGGPTLPLVLAGAVCAAAIGTRARLIR